MLLLLPALGRSGEGLRLDRLAAADLNASTAAMLALLPHLVKEPLPFAAPVAAARADKLLLLIPVPLPAVSLQSWPSP